MQIIQDFVHKNSEPILTDFTSNITNKNSYNSNIKSSINSHGKFDKLRLASKSSYYNDLHFLPSNKIESVKETKFIKNNSNLKDQTNHYEDNLFNKSFDRSNHKTQSIWSNASGKIHSGKKSYNRDMNIESTSRGRKNHKFLKLDFRGFKKANYKEIDSQSENNVNNQNNLKQSKNLTFERIDQCINQNLDDRESKDKFEVNHQNLNTKSEDL